MTKEDITNFSKRIAQSNKTQLVVITYEIIVNYIDSAIKAKELCNDREFIHNLQKAQQFLNDLTSALDYSYEISYDLLSLYSYANRCLAHSIAGNKDCDLATVKSMMLRLMESFDKISVNDDSGAVMKNADTVYAGLTYGKGTLNEVAGRGSTYN